MVDYFFPYHFQYLRENTFSQNSFKTFSGLKMAPIWDNPDVVSHSEHLARSAISIGFSSPRNLTSIHSLIHGVLGRWFAQPVVIAVALCTFSGNFEYTLSFLLYLPIFFIRVIWSGREICPILMDP